jgi:hypothetical protein
MCHVIKLKRNGDYDLVAYWNVTSVCKKCNFRKFKFHTIAEIMSSLIFGFRIMECETLKPGYYIITVCDTVCFDFACL